MLKYFYDSASGLGDIIAPTPENLEQNVKNAMLYEASYENNAQKVFDLIFVGASPVGFNEVGNAPIHIAAREGHLKLVKIFVEANSNCINLKGRGGNTPLHYVASAKYITERHFCVIEFLLKKGADGLIKNDKSRSAYDVCSKRGKYAQKARDTLDKCLLGYCTWLNADDNNSNDQNKKEEEEEENNDLLTFDINEYKEQGADIFINKVLRSPSASIDSNNSNSLNNSLSRRYSQQVRSSSASIDHKMNNSDRKKQRDENEKNLINNNNNKQTTDVNNNNKRDNSSSRRNGNNYQKQQAISNFLDSYRFRNNSTSMDRGDREEEEEEEEEFVINEDVLKEIDDDDNNNSDDDETSLNQSANSYFVELDGNKYVIDDSDFADAMLDDGYGDLYDENGKINYDINAGKSNIVDTIKEVGLFFNKSINDEDNDDINTATEVNESDDSGKNNQTIYLNNDNVDNTQVDTPSNSSGDKILESSNNKSKGNFMKKISTVANQITQKTVDLVNEHTKNINRSNDDSNSYINVKINLNEITNGLGVQFDQFLRVVAFRPGSKPTVLEECGVLVGDLLDEINGKEAHPPLHQALALLKETTMNAKGGILMLRFIRKICTYDIL